jgi:DNA polymerase elongation subunit (family B)
MRKRIEAQKKVKEYVKIHKTTQSDKYKLLDSEQFNIKNFMNSAFGVLGLPIDRAYSLLAFNSATVSCQDVTMFVINKLKEWRIKILAGDTDSALIQGKGETIDELIEYGEEVCKKLNEEIKEYMWFAYNIDPKDNYIKIGLETISDKFYVESKKHYIKRNVYAEGTILKEPELQIKGMQLKKRDTSQLGSDNQTKLIGFIFEEDFPLEKITSYILKVEKNIRDMPWSYVCKHGALNKDLDKYPDSNESATAARNTLRYFGKYYPPGSKCVSRSCS